MRKQFELHQLCNSNDEKDLLAKMKTCLEEGADIDELDNKGYSPIYYAINKDNEELVDYLLSKNADPNQAALCVSPPIFSLVIANRKRMIIKLLNSARAHEIVNVKDSYNRTPLFFAARFGNTEIVQLLLARGADQRICSQGDHVSPLHIALHHGHLNILKQLLDADPSLINSVSILLNNNYSLLFYAAQIGNLKAASFFLERGARVNATFNNKISALYVAAQNGHDAIVELLLKNGADYENLGDFDSNGELITPLEIAGINGNVSCAEILLTVNYKQNTLSKALHYSTTAALKEIGPESQEKSIFISEKIKKKLDSQLALEPLTLNDTKPATWEYSFYCLFKRFFREEDEHPSNKEAAIRFALASMYQLLQDPKACIPYLKFLSDQLDEHWKKETGQSFPQFNVNQVDFLHQNTMLWSIPKDCYQGVKKMHLLKRILLNKFNQYGMGLEQSKWTGFIPKNLSKELLFNNVFFTENKRTISGLFHGDMHNIQRFILLLAMEEGKIPTRFNYEGKEIRLEYKEIFSAVMKRNSAPSTRISNATLWTTMFDIADYSYVTFSHPQRLNSILLTESSCAGALQNYLRYSFCTQFTQMRDLHNWVYRKNYDNKALWDVLLSKIKFHLFCDIPEFAIQMDEKRKLQKVTRIDELQSKREWNIQKKHYASIPELVKHYSSDSEQNSFFQKGKNDSNSRESNDSFQFKN